MSAGMRWILLLSLTACGASGDYSSGGGAFSGDAGGGCLSSNECPTGTTCNDFGQCEAPPPMGDGGVTTPPETEYTLGTPITAQRFVYVPMTAENELARIDGATLAVTATAVGNAPRDGRGGGRRRRLR